MVDAEERSGDDHGWLFPRHRSTVGWADQSGKLMGVAMRSCDWTWDMHWLRHGFASWSLHPIEDGGYGLPLKTVSKHLGHSRPSLTEDMYLEEGPDKDTTWRRTQHRPGRR